MRVLLLSIAFVVVSGVATGATLQCAPGTLDDYFALGSGGCQLGDIVVSDFAAEPLLFGSTLISPASVLVTPLMAMNGFRLDLNAAAGPGSILESKFSFVAASPVSYPIVSAGLQLMGSQAAQGGVALGLADLCIGGEFVGGCQNAQDALATFNDGSDAQLMDVRMFSTNQLGVILNGIADAGPGNLGSAAITSLTFTIQAVPEPATTLTTAAGLLAALVIFRRRGI